MSTKSITPEWVHHAVFYQIFPDRFASSKLVEKPGTLEAWDSLPTANGFKGGDLHGISENLDYLHDLGITALYLNPVFQSASNHRYHTHDYYQVDPLLGGNKALHHLVKQAHRRGIKIVLDGVFNHASRGFFQFNHILECGADSPYLDWFDVRGYPMNAYWGRPNYRCYADLAALPEFNHRNPQVAQFIYDVARYWIEEYDIDGWRLDVPFLFGDAEFWQKFREVIKKANPYAYITGEIPEDASPWLQGDQFDGVMNYQMAYCAWGFFGGKELNHEMVGHWAKHAGHMLSHHTFDFAHNIEGLLVKYPESIVNAQLNMLDSHDTARLRTLFGGDLDRVKLATVFQMTYPGAPCIYYGNEIGLEGGKDPDSRRSFPWDKNLWDVELQNWFKKIISIRKHHHILRQGTYTFLHAKDGVIAILRQFHEEQAVIILNNSHNTLHLDLDMKGIFPDGKMFYDHLQESEVHVTHGYLAQLYTPPMGASILI